MTEPNDIPAILARADAATPGPWRWNGRYGADGLFGLDGAGEMILSDGSAAGEYSPEIDVHGADAIFIAHSRTDVPNMAAEILSLRAQLKEAKEIVDGASHSGALELAKLIAEGNTASKRLAVLEELVAAARLDSGPLGDGVLVFQNVNDDEGQRHNTLTEAADAELLSRREKENG